MEMRLFTLLAVGLCLAGLPASRSPSRPARPDATLIEDLVVANRVLADLGVLDGFGHVSVRHDKDANRYLDVAQHGAGAGKADDVLEYDLESTAVDAKGRALFSSGSFTARSTRRARGQGDRPQPFAVGHPLRRVADQAAADLSHELVPGLDVPVFEIRDIAGPASDLLVRNAQIGAALAKALGDKTVVLMRRHGSVTVGTSIPQVVFRAYYAEMNARLQSEAIKLGAVTYLSAEEAAASAKTNDALVMRPWELWKRKVTKPE